MKEFCKNNVFNKKKRKKTQIFIFNKIKVHMSPLASYFFCFFLCRQTSISFHSLYCQEIEYSILFCSMFFFLLHILEFIQILFGYYNSFLYYANMLAYDDVLILEGGRFCFIFSNFCIYSFF